MELLNDYDRLERAIVPDRATGQPVMGFAIQSRLFLQAGAQTPARQAVARAMQRFRQLAPQHITHIQPDAAQRPQAIGGADVTAELGQTLARLDPEFDAFTPHLTSWPARPPKWQASATLEPGSEGADAVSVFDAAVPPVFLRANPDAYLSALLDWCELLQPLHGLGGIAPVYEFGMSRNHMGETWPFLARFPGLDYPLPYAVAAKGQAPRKISGTNWLTILGDQILTAMGGQGELIARLGRAWSRVTDAPLAPEAGLPADISLHAYRGGVVVRAGLIPQMGDVNRGNIPESYQVVNAALRPLRFDDYQQNPKDLIDVPRPLDAYQETLNWLNRFDVVD